MAKLRAEDFDNPFDMYVYNAHMYQDLIDCVTEVLGECEHMGELARCGEISSDTIEDMMKWKRRRKYLLIRDFVEYWGSVDEEDIVI